MLSPKPFERLVRTFRYSQFAITHLHSFTLAILDTKQRVEGVFGTAEALGELFNTIEARSIVDYSLRHGPLADDVEGVPYASRGLCVADNGDSSFAGASQHAAG